MLTRTVLCRSLASRISCSELAFRHLRTVSRISNVTPITQTSSAKPARQAVSSERGTDMPQQSWLTQKIRSSSVARKVFMSVAKLLGYGTPRQIAGRRAFGIYEKVCIVQADEDSKFWKEACHLPPTFQSWFTITNLHVWLLTVRLRALPPPHGDAYIQGLIDHFFIDVEDRIRAVLQPSPHPPYTPISQFYANPNASTDSDQRQKRRGRAPDRLVSRQMRIFKEQWTGMGMAFDLGFVKGDMEMAGAVWRNLLGARGARGITYEKSTAQANLTTPFRRSINFVGGLVENPAKVDHRGLDVEEARDDSSGVHDFLPSEVDKYVAFPEVMVDVVAYMRRELQRLERVPDEEIIRGDIMSLKFGMVRT